MLSSYFFISGYFFIKRVDIVFFKLEILQRQEAFRSSNLPSQLSIDLGGYWEYFEIWRR